MKGEKEKKNQNSFKNGISHIYVVNTDIQILPYMFLQNFIQFSKITYILMFLKL